MLSRPKSIFDDWHPFVPTGVTRTSVPANSRPPMPSAIRENAWIYRSLMRDRVGVEKTLQSARMIAAEERKKFDASHGTDDAWIKQHNSQVSFYEDPAVYKAYSEAGAQDIYKYIRESIAASQWGWDNASELDEMMDEIKRTASEDEEYYG